MSMNRSRWAAIGAAVAVTLGAGGVGITQATTDSGDGPVSAFFPIEPCRLADDTTIGADASITLDGTGTSGACELPESVTGLAANVTAVGATQQTNLRFYAEGGDVPETANLNPTPGAPPTPNAVNIPVNANTGQFSVYNRFGSVSVFIDVLGYYDDHTHDDRYYTKDEVDALVGPGGGTGNYELSIPATSFDVRAAESERQIGSGGQFIVSSGTDDLAYASVELPDGATITGMRAWLWDESPSSLEVRLRAVGNTSGYLDVSPVITTTGSAAATVEYSVDVADYVFDVDQRSLVVQVFVPDGDWPTIRFGLRLQHVIIEYSL